MRRLINNRMYPSVNGGPRRMWDPDDICGLKDDKVYAKSEGWYPKTKIKANDSLETNMMLYCDFEQFNKDISNCPSFKAALIKYWAVAKVNITNGASDYTYYLALQRGRFPYLLKVNSSGGIAAATDCGSFFNDTKYGTAILVPGINTPWTVVEVYSSCVSYIAEFKVLKVGSNLLPKYQCYCDISNIEANTVIFKTAKYEVLWDGTNMYLDTLKLATKLDNNIAIFKPGISETVTSVNKLCYYVEA